MIKKIHLIHHTHFDIGYTDLPEEVVQQHVCNIDMAIRLAQKNPAFRWTLESGSFVEYYLARRSSEAGEALLSLLRSGQFEVEALNMQMLTETAGSAELVRNVSITVESGKKHGYKDGRMIKVSKTGSATVTAKSGNLKIHRRGITDIRKVA